MEVRKSKPKKGPGMETVEVEKVYGSQHYTITQPAPWTGEGGRIRQGWYPGAHAHMLQPRHANPTLLENIYQMDQRQMQVMNDSERRLDQEARQRERNRERQLLREARKTPARPPPGPGSIRDRSPPRH